MNSLPLLTAVWTFSLCAPLVAAPVAVEGITFVKQVEAISEYRLEANGLTILLLPDHSAPAVTYMVTYRVGSRNESYGTTGATHLLEHLMFKGTAKHNKESGTGFDQLLERTGAETNATTWTDRTNYFETVGPQDLPLVVALEADRMRNLRLREEDRQPEMTVVRNEFERGENSPANVLETEMWAAAYLAHPYHHNTIGWRSDVENVPIGKLRAFYDTYYWPDNATVSVIGDFEAETALALIRQEYSAIPRAPQGIPPVYTEEPAQTGPRRVMVQKPGEPAIVAIAHKSPAGRDPDYPAVAVMTTILTNGRNSRLYPVLTDAGLTSDVFSWPNFMLDPSLHITLAELTPGTKPEQVESVMLEEIAALARDGVTAEEVAHAVAKMTAMTAFQRDGSFAMADALNDCIAVGDWSLYYTLDGAVRAVTPADVQRVARKYLVPAKSTTGVFLPAEAAEEAESAESADKPEAAGSPAAAPAARVAIAEPPVKSGPVPQVAKMAPGIVRTKPAGLDLLVRAGGAKDVITFTGSLPAWDGNPVTLSLAAGMLERGTKHRSAEEIAAVLDRTGASLAFSGGAGLLEFSGRCLKKDVSEVVALLAELLREPALPEEEFAKLRTQALADAAENAEDAEVQAAVAFSQAMYAPGHPNRRLDPAGETAALEAASRDAVRDFIATWWGPSQMVLVMVGDVDPAAAEEMVGKAFAGWTGGKALPEFPTAAPAAEKQIRVPVAGKESVNVIMGVRSGLTVRDAGRLPLSLATAVLGQGFTSRLIGQVRDTEGLTYGITARLTGDSLTPGLWSVRATFAPSLLDRGLASTRRELHAWCQEGITAAEFRYRQDALCGAWYVGLTTSSGLAGAIHDTVRGGLPLTWLDDYPEQVRALTLEQVNAAIRQVVSEADIVSVVAGDVGEK